MDTLTTTNGSHGNAMLPETVLEMVTASGDLGKLSPAQRSQYITALCSSMGLNALSRPIELVNLNGKTVPYAKKDCTDQLRKIHSISITITDRTTDDGVYTVTARATTPEGRCDEDVGAVTVANLKGDHLANATMKAHTKAKRRVTLSICGLGILDESELETVRGARVIAADEEPAPIAIAAQSERPAQVDTEVVDFWIARMGDAETVEALDVARAECKAEVSDTATLALIGKAYKAAKAKLEAK
jgi:hypothetical protein